MAEQGMTILALTFPLIRANSISMNTPKYHTKDLVKFFAKKKIATLEKLKEVMGNPARCTIFRKLGELSYLSSYSHRGKYYTLKSSAAELKDILHVKTKHALIQLVRSDRLQRERIRSVYIYFSADRKVMMRQKKVRAALSKKSSASMIITNPDMAAEEAKATILLFCSMLDEKQRRLYAGLESLKLGHGGDAHIASLLNIDTHTVARGRQELVSGEIAADAVRVSGGGRLSQEKKRLKS
jgi:hypothetical protein